MNDKRVLLGRCGAAHGIKGEVRVKPFTADPGGIATYGPLTLEDGSGTLEIERFREADTVLVVKFKGVNDRTAAEKLNGLGLTVARGVMPATEEDDEFYLTDLIGLRVEDGSGKAVGDILNVVNFGAGDLLEIQPPRGTSAYLPFSPDFVPEVDIEGGRVVIAPPDDLFKESAPGEAPPKKRTRSPRARDRFAKASDDGAGGGIGA